MLKPLLGPLPLGLHMGLLPLLLRPCRGRLVGTQLEAHSCHTCRTWCSMQDCHCHRHMAVVGWDLDTHVGSHTRLQHNVVSKPHPTQRVGASRRTPPTATIAFARSVCAGAGQCVQHPHAHCRACTDQHSLTYRVVVVLRLWVVEGVVRPCLLVVVGHHSRCALLVSRHPCQSAMEDWPRCSTRTCIGRWQAHW
jgi:hypothetical protein